jgi:hypothetical protein
VSFRFCRVLGGTLKKLCIGGNIMAFIKKTEGSPLIITPSTSPLAQHSKIDGIGALTVSLPKNIYFAMYNDPDWQWYFDGEMKP